MGIALGGCGADQHAGHGHAGGEVLAWAVILHRIPEGIGIWCIVPRTLGFWPAVLVTVVTVSATLQVTYEIE